MVRRSAEVLGPKNGHTLMVGIVCRISGGPRQKELSLDDQQDNARETVSDLYDGPVEYRVIATIGKGERTDRPELVEVERELRSGKFDLFIYDDLGRLVRGGEAARLLGVGVDNGTRSITLHECIDTADDNWEQEALSACSDHVAYNAITSKRIKQKLMNRFKKLGQAVARPIAGYIVPPEARSYDDWQKDLDAVVTIQEGARLLQSTLNCSRVADWFNAQQFSVGPYCRNEAWSGPMVRRYYSNSLLKGKPSRGAKHSVKHHETGRRRSEWNPKGPTFYDAPHLAHLDPDEFDILNRQLTQRNAMYRRPLVNGSDPLSRIPRKRTRFPGQHAKCWYCGRDCVWGGNGITDNMMCNGSREWHCWNSIGFSGPLLAEKLVEAICGDLDRIAGFHDQFASMVLEASRSGTANVTQAVHKLRLEKAGLEKRKTNFQASIAEYGPLPMFQEKLTEILADERRLVLDHERLSVQQSGLMKLPQSPGELRSCLETEFRRLAIDSPEFGELMRVLVPDVFIYLVQLCDGGRPMTRANVRLNLGGLYPDATLVPELHTLLSQDLTLDLFTPPRREQVRLDSVGLASQGLMLREISARIDSHPTQDIISDALLLHAKMELLGLDNPYVTLLEPPSDYKKLRRYKNPKYRFEALKGYRA